MYAEHDDLWLDLIPTPEPLPAVVGGFVLVWGWALKETSGAIPAVVNLISGTDATGLPVIPFQLSPSESTRDGVFARPLRFPGGLFTQIVSGTVTGSVYITPGYPGELTSFGRVRNREGQR